MKNFSKVSWIIALTAVLVFTMIACEEESTYIITFDANGGSVTPANAVTGKDGRLASLPTPIYAQWTEHTYYIIFNANGGQVSPLDSYTIAGRRLESLPTPTRSGYIFSGWWTDETDGTEITTSTVFTENTTVYARWETGVAVPGDNLIEKLDWLPRNAESHGVYYIDITADETIPPRTLSYSGAINITIHLRGIGGNRTIMLDTNSFMFRVNTNVTFVLGNNITLKGHSQNTASMVDVFGGIFIMNTGSAIIDNSYSGVYVDTGTFTMNDGTLSGNGHGVWMGGGTFTMNGGAISDNIAGNGAGVYVNSGTFTMNEGTISDNTATDYGGGVYLNYGTFIMNNGTISGNRATSGGGVYIYSGTFNMRGGTIDGNTAREYGGGVWHRENYYGAFTKTGGTITGYNTTTGGNVVRDNEGVLARRGHAVYVNAVFVEDKRKETTAGPSVNLSSERSSTANWD